MVIATPGQLALAARAMTARPSLRELDRLMRQPGTLATIPPPRPLHKMGRPDDNDNDDDETATAGEQP
jgi:hypothetical protein